MLDFGDKGKNVMNKKTIYTDESLSMGERVADFLPSPAELIKREAIVTVTLELPQTSLDFFKEQAKQEQVSYQRMLQNLINAYAKQRVARME